MPRCADQRVGRSRRRPDVAAAATGTCRAAAADAIRAPASRAAKSSGAGDVAADRARVGDLDRGDRAPDDEPLEAGADGFDFGKLRHRLRAARADSPRHAVSAAACSASFLLRPVQAANSSPFTDGPGGEDLGVVGADRGDLVVGHAEAVLGRQLLQAGLPVEADAVVGDLVEQRVEQLVDDLGRAGEPVLEVDRAEHRLEGVGQDAGLVAAAGDLFAPAQPHELAEPARSGAADRAADVGQRAHVDDRGAQLGQLALGQVGVGQVERFGDDDAEHRVAEELQPLVVRQPAVLVGVGPVGQRALEQRRVEVDARARRQPGRVGCGGRGRLSDGTGDTDGRRGTGTVVGAQTARTCLPSY